MSVETPAAARTERPIDFRSRWCPYCYRILGSMQDAEDLVQETLLAAWRSLYASARHSCWATCSAGTPAHHPDARFAWRIVSSVEFDRLVGLAPGDLRMAAAPDDRVAVAGRE